MGLLAAPAKGELLTRRGGAFAAVVALHVGAVAFLLNARYSERPQPVTAVIQVMNLQPQVQDHQPRPELPVKLVTPPQIDIVVPMVSIHVDVPLPTAITPPPRPVQQVVATRSDAPVMLDQDDVDYLQMPAPRYPRSARLARLQGTVLLWVLIDPEGHPSEVRVHQSSGSEQLDQEGRDAVMKALFKPYRRNGVSLSAQVIIPIEFSLKVRNSGRG